MTTIININQLPNLDPDSEILLDLWAKAFVDSIVKQSKSYIMNKINKKCIGIPELVSIVVGEFSFMQVMTWCDYLIEEKTPPKPELDLLNLQRDLMKKILGQLPSGTILDELDIVWEIEPDELESFLTEFLSGYQDYDTVALQQNIHNKINLLQ